MSLKNSYVTSDYIEWDIMLSLVRKLYRDKEWLWLFLRVTYIGYSRSHMVYVIG